MPIESRLPELIEVERIIDSLQDTLKGKVSVEVLARASAANHILPVYGIQIGSKSPQAPTFGIFAGVHGLERIGTRVATSYLSTLAKLLKWDRTIHGLLEHIRIVSIPLINPAGMYLRHRSNARGVDLMRNAPVEAVGTSPLALLAGHRLSPKIPWFRGHEGEPMEAEAQAVCDFVRREMFQSKMAISIDIHSGFGVVDRLWFPWAKVQRPFPHLPEAYALKRLLDETYPNHVYVVEPQSLQYTTHGDLWDYLYAERSASADGGIYLPLSLEMGSWLWVKKNPRQLFNVLGVFNPLIPHRFQRILRRHITLLDFLKKAVASSESWAFPQDFERDKLADAAKSVWFPDIDIDSPSDGELGKTPRQAS